MTDVIAPRVRAVENMVARAQAATKQGNTQGACLACEAKLWVTFFFDGTGNHRDLHFPRKHSNVAALFDAHANEQAEGIAAFYYEGVGMPFEFKDRYESRTVVTRWGPHKVEKVGHKEGESSWNQALGTEIDKRLEKAMFDFQTYVEDWRRKRRVNEINVAAFGFSRGSTEARAFMHWMRAHSKMSESGSKLTYDGIPVNVKFLGLFDTVESVGWAADNTEPELVKTSLPSFVQKCFHIIAAHELRHAFPSTVLGTDRYKQVVYPGAHADVGGGYVNLEQGRSNALPRVGLLQMLDEARGAGLKMGSVGEMEAQKVRWDDTYKHSFNVAPSAKAAFVDYMKYVKPQAGPIEDVFRAHCTLYQAWIDSGLAIEDVGQKLAAARSNGGGRGPRVDEAVVEQHLLSNLARTRTGRGATIEGARSAALFRPRSKASSRTTCTIRFSTSLCLEAPWKRTSERVLNFVCEA